MALEYRSPFGLCEDADLKRSPRFEHPLGVFDELFGKDFSELEDIAIVSGIENMVQSLKNRIMTRKGELRVLGHPEYGSLHHELLGRPNTDSNRNLVKFHLMECLSHDPRIEKILRMIIMPDPDDRNLFRVEIELKIIDLSTPLNLIIPFNFAVEI